jgi:hypothetical protein
MLLPKLAVIADTLDRQRIGRLPRAGRLAEGELLMGGLRQAIELFYISQINADKPTLHPTLRFAL